VDRTITINKHEAPSEDNKKLGGGNMTFLRKTLHRAHLSQDVVLEGNVLLAKYSPVLVGSQSVYQQWGNELGICAHLNRRNAFMTTCSWEEININSRWNKTQTLDSQITINFKESLLRFIRRITVIRQWLYINHLTPNGHYTGRTAQLTSRCYISYIYSTNIRTEYFKHAA